jgi:hypothetical protein
MNQSSLLQKTWFLIVLFTVITVLVTVPGYFQTIKTFHEGGIQYTSYNNYIIFKQSFYHLINQKDLYQLYPQEHWDLYKYSPAFALLMAPLAVLPDFAGLLIWNLLNVLILTWAFRQLPLLTMRQKWMMLGFVLLELITSLQNEQSNALIAGLLMLAFVQLENKKPFWAALFIVLTVAIKLFGLVGFALFLFYPQKLKAAFYTIFWIVFFALIPLLVVDAEQLIYLYKSWWQLLKYDHSASYGLSVAGWLYAWFGVDFKNLTVIAGVLLFCIPLLRLNLYNNLRFRALMLASVLLWVVIFNHKAESPTFIIAVSGAAIWYFYQKQNKLNLLLLLLAFIFTILSPTDLFPKSIRESFVIPYVLKAVACIFIWIKLIADLLTMKTGLQTEQSITES